MKKYARKIERAVAYILVACLISSCTLVQIRAQGPIENEIDIPQDTVEEITITEPSEPETEPTVPSEPETQPTEPVELITDAPQ